MRKTIVACVASLAVVAAVIMLAQSVAAQGPGGFGADRLLLQGPGSMIGVTVRELRAEERTTSVDTGGVVIEAVRDDSPAASAGLRSGDIVVEFDSERVRSVRNFTRLVVETPPGRAVPAVVVRGDSRQTLQVTPAPGGRVSIDLPDVTQFQRGLRDRARDFDFNFDFPRDFDFPREGLTVLRGVRLGMTLSPLSDQLAAFFGVRSGALVSSVEEGTVAAQAGVRAGDVITAINGRTVSSVGDATAALREVTSGSPVSIRVTRDKQEMTLSATMPQQPEFNRRPLRNQVPI